jgi:type I restriction enzyme S subunit
VIAELVSLGSLLRFERREVIVDAQDEYPEVGIYSFGRGLFHKLPRSGLEVGNKRLFIIYEGDLLIHLTFAWEGAVALASAKDHGRYGSVRMLTFRVDELKSFPLYLLWYLRTPDGVAQLGRITPGSAGRNRVLNIKRIPEVKIPLPPLSEQRRIVAKIERLATKIDEARELRHRSFGETAFSARNISGSVFSELEKQFESRPFASFDPHVSSGPRNWSQYYADEGLRFYRAQDVGPDGKILDTNPQFIQPPINGQGRSARLEANDIILVITGATIGRVAVFGPEHAPGLVNQHVAVCRFPLDRVCVRYILWGLRSPIGQVQLLGDKYGQGKPGLNLNNIRSIKLPFPPISEQGAIVAYLDGLEAKVDRLKALQAQTQAELDALLPSILDRAFKGEL